MTLQAGHSRERRRLMARKSNLNLDVDAPDDVAVVLRRAAEAYYEAAGEVESSWQEKAPGTPWIRIAQILEAAAGEINSTDLYAP